MLVKISIKLLLRKFHSGYKNMQEIFWLTKAFTGLKTKNPGGKQDFFNIFKIYTFTK